MSLSLSKLSWWPGEGGRKQSSSLCELPGETRFTHRKHSENEAVISRYAVDSGNHMLKCVCKCSGRTQGGGLNDFPSFMERCKDVIKRA